jgi:thiol-disulfide isomerase/thioredoxin
MFNNTIWLIIILISLILIYFLTTFNATIYINSDLKKKKKFHSKPKKIYLSPSMTYDKKSIKSMTNKLIKKLNIPIKNKNNYSIKFFYADWCNHCVDFKPIWNKLKLKYNNINFIDVDCTTKQPNLQFINGFPTIAIFDSNNKHIKNYENERTYYIFKQFLDKLNI